MLNICENLFILGHSFSEFSYPSLERRICTTKLIQLTQAKPDEPLESAPVISFGFMNWPSK